MTVDDTVSPAVTYLSGGPDLHFTVSVVMHLKLHPLLVRCGWLSGDAFPGYGPVKGVDVSWDNSELAPWGSFSCDRVGCDKTGTDGQARETFTPGTEDVHRGMQIYEPGMVHAIAFVGSSLGNKIIGTAFDLLRVTGGMRWEVRHHKTGYPTGFTAHVKIGGGSLAVDVTVTGAVKQPKSTFCAPGGCTYEVQNITGTVTSLGNNCGTVSVPPFKIDGGYWSIGTFLSGGKYVQKLWVTIEFTTGNNSCGLQYLVAIDDDKPGGQLPVYEFGETNSTVNLAYPGQGTGVATIKWAY